MIEMLSFISFNEMGMVTFTVLSNPFLLDEMCFQLGTEMGLQYLITRVGPNNASVCIKAHRFTPEF